MNQEQNRVRMSFQIRDEEFDPQEVTEALSITPDKAFRKGDRVENTPGIRSFSTWILDSDLNPEMDLEAHIKQMLRKLSDKSKEVKTLSQKHHVEMFISLFQEDDKTRLYLEAEVLEQLAEMGITVVIDLYNWSLSED